MNEFNPLDMPIIEIDEATKAEKTSRFEASRFLESPATISAFLAESMREGGPDDLMRAIGEVAKAVGINKVAMDAGVNRESLYKTIKPGTKPRFDTIQRLLDALDVELTVRPKKKKAPAVAYSGLVMRRSDGEYIRGKAQTKSSIAYVISKQGSGSESGIYSVPGKAVKPKAARKDKAS